MNYLPAWIVRAWRPALAGGEGLWEVQCEECRVVRYLTGEAMQRSQNGEWCDCD